MEEESAAYLRAFDELQELICDRVQRFSTRLRPRLELTLHASSGGRKILHASRLTADAPVLLLYVFAGLIPSRYDFLFDDSTDDLRFPPPLLYPEEGVDSAQVRPEPGELLERIQHCHRVLPIKGFLPVRVAAPAKGETFFRFLQRGGVMEAEVREGTAFRNLLEPEEAERLAGHLVRLKLEGKIELEFAST
jgi:hypothetical protein